MEALTINIGFAVALTLGIVIPLYRWASKATALLARIDMVSAQLLQMHQNPDEHNFGTERTNKLIEDSVKEQTSLMRQLVHYARWYVEATTGKKPPPFVDQI